MEWRQGQWDWLDVCVVASDVGEDDVMREDGCDEKGSQQVHHPRPAVPAAHLVCPVGSGWKKWVTPACIWQLLENFVTFKDVARRLFFLIISLMALLHIAWKVCFLLGDPPYYWCQYTFTTWICKGYWLCLFVSWLPSLVEKLYEFLLNFTIWLDIWNKEVEK